MKIQQFKAALSGILSKVSFLSLFIALSFLSLSNSYGQNYPVAGNPNASRWISLKGESTGQYDLLQWEITNPNNIAYFTIQASKSNEMAFTETAVISPLDCMDPSKVGSFKYSCDCNNDPSNTYYKIIAVLKDNNTLESNFIYVRKTSTNVASLDISDIKNQSGQVTLTFKSPKAQNVTLHILNRTGTLLAVQNIAASEGINTFSFDASSNNTEMLIFSLNNAEEQVTKKYLLASIW